MRTSFSASRKRTCIWYFFLRVLRTSLISDREPFSRISIPIPLFLIALFLDMIDAKESMSAIGRLSTQKNPESSRALKATVLPEPERPVRMTMMGFNSLTMTQDVSSFYRFYETEIAVSSAIDNIDITTLVVCENEEILVEEFHLHCRFIRAHRLQFGSFFFFNPAGFRR